MLRSKSLFNKGYSCSWNLGQCCCAGTRIFVHEKVYDEFLKKFTEKTKKVTVGDPFAKNSDIGALVSDQQYDVRSTISILARC